MEYKIYNDDCLKTMKNIKDKSVDLVLIDPPYNIKKDKTWDSWKTVNDYVDFMGNVFLECQRVLKDNGSFYFFHNDFLQIVELQNFINNNTRFKLNSFIVWQKPNFKTFGWKNPTNKTTLRKWFNICEYCLYYTFEDVTGLEKIVNDINSFKSLRNYFKEFQEATEMTLKQITNNIGRRAEHCFYWGSSQWSLPTEQTYSDLLKLIKNKQFKVRKYEDLKEEYKKLREEYEDLRKEYESQRFVHNLDKEHCNVWTSNLRNTGEYHSCQKPLDILERIIKTSTNENQLVLDCFMGSGSTGVACMNTNRNFIGIELDKKYFDIASKRIEEAIQENKGNI